MRLIRLRENQQIQCSNLWKERPHSTRGHQEHSPEMSVWCAVSRIWMFGLYCLGSLTITGSTGCPEKEDENKTHTAQ